MATPPELSSLRQRIDVLDRELVELLARRRDVVSRVSKVKKAHALPAQDPAREATMRAELIAYGRSLDVPEALITRVLEVILEDSRALVSRG